MATPIVKILHRTKSGEAYTIVGLVDGRRVSVQIGAAQIDGLKEADADKRMARSLLSCARYLESQAGVGQNQG